MRIRTALDSTVHGKTRHTTSDVDADADASTALWHIHTAARVWVYHTMPYTRPHFANMKMRGTVPLWSCEPSPVDHVLTYLENSGRGLG